MSINPSVLIWTVINFCILLCSLYFVLFKPLLSFMHERNERIVRGINAGKDADTRLALIKSGAAEKLDALRIEELKSSERLLHEARVEKRLEIERSHNETDALKAEYIEALSGTEAEAEAELDGKLDSLSELIASKLTEAMSGKSI